MSTYSNPVYPGYFADPFVWKHNDVYYAIGTGPHEAEGEVDDAGLSRVFPLLTSTDFVTWTSCRHALVRLGQEFGDSYWAPEVAYSEGRFWLYYSVGHADKAHQLRVASSENPLGPYRDSGQALINPARCAFAIDPHPFQDDDGQWYLFYARDFLDTEDGNRAGTALAVDRLVNMTQLAGQERVVLRARSDWQGFLNERLMYEGIYDWHTLEGPCVRKHEGRYYCFYSGGRWETETYGVDYGVADKVTGPYSDIGNEQGARVLRTVPGRAIGPGHNSIVMGPDGETEYVAYHAWDAAMTARRLFLDRLVWTPEGARCEGPTLTPQTIGEGRTRKT